jgi:preprotein translocase subunit SecE
MFEKAKQFLKEVKIELKKVVWPTRKDTIASTSVVLIIVMIIAFFLGLADLGLSRIIRLILG